MTLDLTLNTLAEDVPVRHRAGPTDPRVEDASADSRKVRPGVVFVAIRGDRADGHAFVDQAVAQGAAAIVVTTGAELTAQIPPTVSVYETDDPRRLLGVLVRNLRSRPDLDLTLVATTGTNGKTSVSHIVRDLLQARGQRCGLLGTIRYETGRVTVPAPLTTPGVEDLYAYWAEMRDVGLRACAMEASSHALHQGRLGPAEIDVAAFLNVTREHLDYHANLEEYLAAKLRLREHLAGASRTKSPGIAVVNGDDPTLATVSWPAGTILVGRKPEAAVRLLDVRCDRNGTTLEVEIARQRLLCRCALLGRYNAENLLAAVGIAHALGFANEEIESACSAVRPVPGRLESVDLEGGPLCLVDYAHTPDGIRSTLTACRQLTSGRIILVFGCGGDRDRGKRPLMAKAAVEGADQVVLTLDNPRTEDPEQIFGDTEAGFGPAAAEGRARRIEDRQEAIDAAIGLAAGEDLVLVAGKGHETYQILKEQKLAWDDRDAIRRAWRDRRGEAS